MHFKRKKHQEYIPDDQDILDASSSHPPLDKPMLPLKETELEMIGELREHSILSPLAHDFLEISRKGEPLTQKILEKEMSLSALHREGNKEVAPSIIDPVSTGLAVSSFCLDNVASRAYKKFAISIWEDVKEKIIRTPLSHGHTVAKEIKNALGLVDKCEHIDSTPIRTLVERYMEEVKSYSGLVATVGGMMTALSRDKDVAVVRARLVKFKEDMNTATGNKTALHKRLADVDSEIEEIRKRLSECIDARKDLEVLFVSSVNEVDEMDAKIMNLKEAMSTLKGAKVVSDVDLQSLDDLRKKINKTLDEIVHIRWEP